MRVIACFVIDIKLTILILTSRIIIVGSPLVGKLVVTIDVLDFQAICCFPRHAELRALLIELFTVQAIRCCTDIVTPNVPAEDTFIVSSGTFRAGDTKPVKGGCCVAETIKLSKVNAQPVML